MNLDSTLDKYSERSVTLEDIHRLRHMLGVGEHLPRRHWGFRNVYCSANRDELRALEDCGLVRLYRSKKRGSGGVYCWSATLAGAELAGVSKVAIRRLGLHKSAVNS